MARGPVRLRRPASQSRALSRVALWDLSWGAASPLLALILRDGTIKPIAGALSYSGIAVLASILAFQWFKTSSPIARYFSIRDALVLVKACLVVAALSAVLFFVFTRLNEIPRSLPVFQFAIMLSALVAGRVYSRIRQTRLLPATSSAPNSPKHVLIIQASRLAWFFSKIVEELTPGEYQIIAILDSRPELQRRSVNGYPVVGEPAAIEKIIEEYALHGIQIDKVFVATQAESLSKEAWRTVTAVCRAHQIELDILPERLIPGLETPKSDSDITPADEPMPAALDSLESILSRPFWRVKRTIDLAVALAIGILTLPMTAIVSLSVLLSVGTPIIFWQRRLGRNGVPLHLYKFRTLQTLFDPHTRAKREAIEPSPIGHFLRKTRLDEIPQLWNIISGDMSLIGPRPLLPIDQPNEPSERLRVRPGLSGWAQVCGGKLISAKEKNALDEWYIRHASFSLDSRIALRTMMMLVVGDHRDEAAIATAIAEKYQGELTKITQSITARISEQRKAYRSRAEVMRTAADIGSRRDDRTQTKSPVEPTARSIIVG